MYHMLHLRFYNLGFYQNLKPTDLIILHFTLQMSMAAQMHVIIKSSPTTVRLSTICGSTIRAMTALWENVHHIAATSTTNNKKIQLKRTNVCLQPTRSRYRSRCLHCTHII